LVERRSAKKPGQYPDRKQFFFSWSQLDVDWYDWLNGLGGGSRGVAVASKGDGELTMTGIARAMPAQQGRQLAELILAES
jgi:hypothetical protein